MMGVGTPPPVGVWEVGGLNVEVGVELGLEKQEEGFWEQGELELLLMDERWKRRKPRMRPVMTSRVTMKMKILVALPM